MQSPKRFELPPLHMSLEAEQPESPRVITQRVDFEKTDIPSQSKLLDALVAIHDDCQVWSLDQKVPEPVKCFLRDNEQVVKEIKASRLRPIQFREVVLMLTPDGKHVAMKTLSKQYLLRRKDQTCFMEERDVLVAGRDQWWMPRLEAALQDEEHLHLVMDFAPGGDLLGLLERQDAATISEDHARFYIAELIVALDALHSFGFVHRDIKPGNILITAHGHIQLTDYGSCARITSNGRVASSVTVGTPDYISPEVLQAQEMTTSLSPAYGRECDWWSVGVLLYECLYGDPPFAADSLPETYNRIMNSNKYLDFPNNSSISEAAKDLISKLLRPRNARLGRQGVQEIQNHPFFANIDWNSILEMDPPFKPKLKHLGDAKYFEDAIDGDDLPPDPTLPMVALSPRLRPSDFQGIHLPFIGYTFVCEDENTKTKETERQEAQASIELQTTIKAQEETINNLKQQLAAFAGERQRLEHQMQQITAEAVIEQNRLLAELKVITGQFRQLVDMAHQIFHNANEAELRTDKRVGDLQRDRLSLISQLEWANSERDAAVKAAAQTATRLIALDNENNTLLDALTAARHQTQVLIEDRDFILAELKEIQNNQQLSNSKPNRLEQQQQPGQSVLNPGMTQLRSAIDMAAMDRVRLEERVMWLESAVRTHIAASDAKESTRLIQTLRNHPSKQPHSCNRIDENKEESFHDCMEDSIAFLETFYQEVDDNSSTINETNNTAIITPTAMRKTRNARNRPTSIRLTWIRDDFDLMPPGQQFNDIKVNQKGNSIQRTPSTATNTAMQARRAWVRNKSAPLVAVQTAADGDIMQPSAIASIQSPILAKNALTSLSIAALTLANNEDVIIADSIAESTQSKTDTVAQQIENEDMADPAWGCRMS
ncbi:kinase-like domain-containing protein [Syncephalis fuscata]|nr:kinase-like domain-containing protein [Syncephalis fuscata]